LAIPFEFTCALLWGIGVNLTHGGPLFSCLDPLAGFFSCSFGAYAINQLAFLIVSNILSFGLPTLIAACVLYLVITFARPKTLTSLQSDR
jgi:hypothetical protein